MTDISLAKLELLSVNLENLLKDDSVDQATYLELIKNIQKVETYVSTHKNEFVVESDKIITLCKYMIFNLMLKITEFLEDVSGKLVYQ